jgi:hypothetical protein
VGLCLSLTSCMGWLAVLERRLRCSTEWELLCTVMGGGTADCKLSLLVEKCRVAETISENISFERMRDHKYHGQRRDRWGGGAGEPRGAGRSPRSETSMGLEMTRRTDGGET